MIERFPTVVEEFNFADDFKLMEEVKALISKLRNVRAEYGVIPSKRIKLHVIDKTGRLADVAIYIEKLVGCEKIAFETASIGGKLVKAVSPIAEVEIPLGDLVDKDKEIERLTKELKSCQSEIARANGKLNNQGFVAKAPAALIEKEKEKLEKYIELKKGLEESLKNLD
jgi:valyl-tRNA synthetase